jgi:hypothetical protein
MSDPVVFALTYKDGSIGHNVGYAVTFERCAVICWADGVLETYDTPDLSAALATSYGTQWVSALATDGVVIRYIMRETATQSIKGAAIQWPAGHVFICWEDGTREVWPKEQGLDSVLSQYAFEYTFECLDR